MASERGQLKVFIGLAPGVGKTYRMLQEGDRRARRTAVGSRSRFRWGRADGSLLGEILQGLPGVDVQIVADPTRRRAAFSEESADAAAGLRGDGDEALRTGVWP